MVADYRDMYQTSCLCPATLAAGLPGSACRDAVADIVLEYWKVGWKRGSGAVNSSRAQIEELDCSKGRMVDAKGVVQGLMLV
jgi:hypothetical protein